MEREVRCRATEIRAECRESDGQKSNIVSGYAAVFDSWSELLCGWFYEKIDPAAFDDTDFSDVIMCFNHNSEAILARSKSGTLKLKVDNVGLHFEFELPNTTLGNDIAELLKRGDLDKCSFAFFVQTEEWTQPDDEGYAKRVIKKISRLVDTSIVVFPAYNDTEVYARNLDQRKKELFLNNNYSYEKDKEFEYINQLINA